MVDSFLEMLDLIAPGETRRTRILSGMHSIESTSVMERRADFDAQYIPFHGVGLYPESASTKETRMNSSLRISSNGTNVDNKS